MATCERCGLPVTPTYYEQHPHRFPEQCVTVLLSYVKDLEWKLGTTSLELQTAKVMVALAAFYMRPLTPVRPSK